MFLQSSFAPDTVKKAYFDKQTACDVSHEKSRRRSGEKSDNIPCLDKAANNNRISWKSEVSLKMVPCRAEMVCEW